MGIAKKRLGLPPPEDDLPPYAKDTLCWGCDKLFDCTELRVDSGLCYKCHRLISR